MNEPVNRPWIGSHYKEGWEGVRLLVLGESSYGDKSTAPYVLVMHHIKDGTGHWCRTYTRFLHLLDHQNSNLSDAEQRTKIWDRLAFYNYLTAAAGMRPRTPPPEESWGKSEPALFGFLETLDPPPDGVIVWGYRLWYALGKSCRFSERDACQSNPVAQHISTLPPGSWSARSRCAAGAGCGFAGASISDSSGARCAPAGCPRCRQNTVGRLFSAISFERRCDWS